MVRREEKKVECRCGGLKSMGAKRCRKCFTKNKAKSTHPSTWDNGRNKRYRDKKKNGK